MDGAHVDITVDARLLGRVQVARPGASYEELVEAGLRALIDAHEREVDRMYEAAYADRPLEEPDAWGDLMSFRAAVR